MPTLEVSIKFTVHSIQLKAKQQTRSQVLNVQQNETGASHVQLNKHCHCAWATHTHKINTHTHTHTHTCNTLSYPCIHTYTNSAPPHPSNTLTSITPLHTHTHTPTHSPTHPHTDTAQTIYVHTLTYTHTHTHTAQTTHTHTHTAQTNYALTLTATPTYSTNYAHTRWHSDKPPTHLLLLYSVIHVVLVGSLHLCVQSGVAVLRSTWPVGWQQSLQTVESTTSGHKGGAWSKPGSIAGFVARKITACLLLWKRFFQTLDSSVVLTADITHTLLKLRRVWARSGPDWSVFLIVLLCLLLDDMSLSWLWHMKWWLWLCINSYIFCVLLRLFITDSTDTASVESYIHCFTYTS